MADISILNGRVIKEVTGLNDDSDKVTFVMEDGKVYEMYHDQDCCESVYIEDVEGDASMLNGQRVVLAYESSTTECPNEREAGKWREDDEQWTFYRISTFLGVVVIRWYGSSNGYYSTSVDFREQGKGRWD